MREHLKKESGVAAYCCKCCSRTAPVDATPEALSEGMKWTAAEAA